MPHVGHRGIGGASKFNKMENDRFLNAPNAPECNSGALGHWKTSGIKLKLLP